MALGPGSYAFVPRGTPHAYTNVGEAPARMLIMETPGGIQEQFFREVREEITDPADRPGAAEPRDLDEIAAAGAKYGIEFLRPV